MRLSTPIGGVASVAVALTPGWVWAQTQQPAPYAYDCGPHMMWWGGGWYGMIFGPLVMILVLAAVIAAVVLLVRWIGGPWQGAVPPHQAPHARTALDILDERYARGEIQKDEFEEKRRLISRG
ncbi:MAG: SHOCT domain-containing protein [Magnetospirillum sp.]|nr:SHOCT domain-containing protein [Magnetospirillum sp.]